MSTKRRAGKKDPYEALLRAILCSDTQIAFARTFSSGQHSLITTRIINDLMSEFPDISDTVICLVLYRPLRWSLKAKDIDSLIARVETDIATANGKSELYSDIGVQRLCHVQRTLAGADGGVANKVRLEKRKAYFELCQRIIDEIDKAIPQILSRPEQTCDAIYALQYTFFDDEDIEQLSRYKLKRSLASGIQAVHQICGDKLSSLLDEVQRQNDAPSAELAYLYHNTQILVAEYARILWKAAHSSDPAMRMLACNTEAEIDEIDLSARKGTKEQAYRIVEFVKIIRGAIEMLKWFPSFGEKYYKIIGIIIDERPKLTREATMAQKAGISVGNFNETKNEALSVLGSILWGFDVATYLRLVERPRKEG